MSYQDKFRLLRQNIIDLKRKNYLPKHTQGYFDTDPANIRKLLAYTEAETFKEWSCPICGISVYGPRKLLLEHHKVHSMKAEIGENEVYQKSYKVYR